MLEGIDSIGIATVSSDTVKKELLEKLTEKQYKIIKDLVDSSTPQFTLTHTSKIRHNINTGDKLPIRQKEFYNHRVHIGNHSRREN